MSELQREEDRRSTSDQPAEADGADRTRRRLTAAGLAGAGVLMTVSSRSALGASVGGACGSETASAAMSRHGEESQCGCSPGFWWNTNGQRVWSEYIEPNYPQFKRTAKFNDVFCWNLRTDVAKFFVDDATTLHEARMAYGVYPPSNYDTCANRHAVGMHAVAALLNVAYYGRRYPANPRFTHANDVISAFAQALADYTSTTNGNRCRWLTAFKERVDVYNGLWCFNGKDWGY